MCSRDSEELQIDRLVDVVKKSKDVNPQLVSAIYDRTELERTKDKDAVEGKDVPNGEEHT